jgi:hypothetical protein
VEAAPKKKNVKTAVTGVIVAMPRRKQKAEITKISHETFVSLMPKDATYVAQMRDNIISLQRRHENSSGMVTILRRQG